MSILHVMIMTHDSSPRTKVCYTESYGERILRDDLTQWCIALALHTHEISKSKLTTKFLYLNTTIIEILEKFNPSTI